MVRSGPDRELITARDVDRVPRGSDLCVKPGTIVTPWARDRAAVRGVRLVEGTASPGPSPGPLPGPAPGPLPGPAPGPLPGLAAGAAPEAVVVSSASCTASSCSCGGTCSSSASSAPAPAAWISPFANRIIRGPNAAVLLGIERTASSASAY
ncbi:MAG: hypothetical protein IPH13_13935 [Planctomycetes bacterium]|nr:hypothetical protein [Planctomycetota bacterium]MCC7168852.1 hypothetical protein [Planctomycetota bacterium]